MVSRYIFLRLRSVTVLTLKHTIVPRLDKMRLVRFKHFLKKHKNLLKINVLMKPDNGAIKRLCVLLGRSHALGTNIPLG